MLNPGKAGSVEAGEVAALASRLLTDGRFAQAAQRVRLQILEMPDATTLLQTLLANDA